MQPETQNTIQSAYFEATLHALNTIECRLLDDIGVPDVTSMSDKSHWQFQRIFSSVVGISIGQYIRERRLAESLKMLRDPDNRILDIALHFCFGSEEAYSRAFKTFFGLTPSAYRKSQELVLPEARNAITKEKLEYFWTNVHRAPEILTVEEMMLVGTSIEFKSHFVLGAHCHLKVVPHWAQFKSRMHFITNRIGRDRIGVVLSTEMELREERLTYFSGLPVSKIEDVPLEMHPITLPGGLYAAFENRKFENYIGHLMDYIYGIWLPSSKYERAKGFDFEIFPESYVAGDPNSVSRFFIPIQET